MSYSSTRNRLRFGKFGGALVAVTGLLAGCDDTNSATGGDAGDAGTGFLSAEARGDGGAGIDTQDLSVGLDTSQAPDNLSVGLESFADAGVADSSAPATSVAPTTSSDVAPASSVEPADTSVPTVDTSAPAETSSLPVDTSVAPVDTSLPPAQTSDVPDTSSTVETSAVDTSAVVDTSAPRELIQLAIATAATWVDLPATVRSVDLPDANFEFTWRVVSVPNGSQVTDSSLSDATASEATFSPDVAGTYTLSLHVESTDSVGDGEVTVEVAKVDVGFLLFSDGGDGYYGYEPKMVPSDGSTQPFDVGCRFYSWDFDDSTYWRYVMSEETSTLAFSYPQEPGGATLFAHHYRDEDTGYYGTLQVASATSDCAENRPTDLTFGYDPDFSPSVTDLSRIDHSDGTYLLSSPIDVDNAVYPTGTYYLQASDWWDDTSIAWSGNVYDGNVNSYAVAISPIDSEGYQTVVDCAVSRNAYPLFEQYDRPIDKLAIVPGGILAKSMNNLWFLTVTFEDGLPFASCEELFGGNILIASGVADFEVARDGQTLALIAQQYDEQSSTASLAIGPVGEVLEIDSPLWTIVDDAVNLEDYYTGLHWIAGSQQLVWTGVQYEGQFGDGTYTTDIYASAVYKVNADGTHLETLVYNAFDQANLRVVTTGPIDLAYPRYSNLASVQ